MEAEGAQAVDMAESSELHYQYRLEREDMRRFLHWSTRNLPGAKRVIKWQRVFFLVFFTGVPFYGLVRGTGSTAVIATASLLNFAYVLTAAWFGPLVLAWVRAEAALAAESKALGDWQLDVDSAGVNYHGPLGSGDYAWSDFDRVLVQPYAVLLFTSETSVLAIPITAFSGPDEVSRFAHDCSSSIEAART